MTKYKNTKNTNVTIYKKTKYKYDITKKDKKSDKIQSSTTKTKKTRISM